MSLARISISLPKSTLERAETARRHTGESRSEFFRRALEELLEGRKRDRAISEYLEGYVAEPETEYEVEEAASIGRSAFAPDDWESDKEAP